MSRETIEWLNNNVLVGFTSNRGNAWHYRASDQGQESNHYTDAIPVQDVERRLFDWEPVTGPVFAGLPWGISEAGEPTYTYEPIPGKQRIYPSDNPIHTFGIFSDSYRPHGYQEWLIGNVANLLTEDQELQISSAGLLKNRAVAWVEISVPDSVHTPEGVEFRPNLVATTSLDGSIATTYKRTTTLTVCDNTLAAALAEKGETYKRRHTMNSNSKSEQDKARAMLNLLSEAAVKTADDISRLCNWEISNLQFREVIRLAIPFDPESKTGVTVADRKISEITNLYTHDDRVAPWKGTAFGVVQAFNTWNHHVRATRGDTNRAERNMMNAIDGTTDRADADILAHLERAYATV